MLDAKEQHKTHSGSIPLHERPVRHATEGAFLSSHSVCARSQHKDYQMFQSRKVQDTAFDLEEEEPLDG